CRHRPSNPGCAGGGRRARWTAVKSRASSSCWRRPTSAASRSRLSTALAYTASEARRLGLGVDMATGTGWPFGGPEVSTAQGSSTAFLENGRLRGKPTGMKVKRAAPGGEGLVLDPYAPDALDAYLERFRRALAPLPRGGVRSQFHDSFEYYEASWTPRLPEEFQRMHGYDLQA